MFFFLFLNFPVRVSFPSYFPCFVSLLSNFPREGEGGAEGSESFGT